MAAGVSSFKGCSNLTTLLFPEMLTTGDFCLKFKFNNNLRPCKIGNGRRKLFCWLDGCIAYIGSTNCDTGCCGSSTCTTYSMPLATTLENLVFNQCLSATLIDIPLCVNLGNDPTDASVFQFITGNVITLNDRSRKRNQQRNGSTLPLIAAVANSHYPTQPMEIGFNHAACKSDKQHGRESTHHLPALLKQCKQ